MAAHSHLFGRIGKSRRWFRRLLAAALILAAVLFAVGYFITRPTRLARLTASLLSEIAGAPVECESASFNLDGLIHLHHVTLSLPAGAAAQPTLFSVDEVVLQHQMSSLLRGRFRARSLVLVNPTLYLTEDAATGKFTYELLKRQMPKGKHSVLEELPEIQIQGGELQFGEIESGESRPYVELGVIHLSGGLAPQPKVTGAYRFKLQQEEPGGEMGPVLSGTFDLVKLAVTAKLDRFTFESPQRMVLPRRYREWWDRLQPEGNLTTRFAYDPDIGFHVRLDLKAGQITIPYRSSGKEMSARMSEVSGRFNISDNTVTLEDLSGKIRGLSYMVNGRLDGLDPKAPFLIHAQLMPFELTEDGKNLPDLPESVERTISRFQPSGTVKGTITVQRKETGGRIAYAGTAQISNGKGRYFRFPYPLEQVNGEVLFNDERVEIVSMTGVGPHGGKVMLEKGVVSPPGPGASVHVEIAAADFPVDEMMREALEPKHRKVLDMFTDAKQYRRLLELGLILTSEQAKARQAELDSLLAPPPEGRDKPASPATRPAPPPAPNAAQAARIAALRKELEKPVFDLGGRVSFKVTVDRALGPENKYSSIIHINLAGAHSVLTHWPYPIEFTKGTIDIDHGHVQVKEAEFRGPTGLVATANGTVDIARAEDDTGADHKEIVTPRIKIVGVNLPVDPFLLASIPAPEDRWLRDMAVEGKLDLFGDIIRGDAGDVDIDLATQMANGKARPMGGKYNLDRIALRARIQRKRVTISSAEAYHDHTHFKLTGGALWSQGKPLFAARLDATDVNLSDPIFDLLPADEEAGKRVRKIVTDYKLRGLVDGQLTYLSKPKQGATQPAQAKVADASTAPPAPPATTRPGQEPEAVAALDWFSAAESGGGAPLLEEGGYTLELHPHWLGLQLHDRPIELRDIKGRLTIDREGMDLDHFAATLGTGKLTLSGHVDTSGAAADLSVDVQDTTFHGKAMDLLPANLRKSLGSLDLDGGFHLHDSRLVYHKSPAAGQTFIELNGHMDLEQAKADISIPVTEIDGALAIHATLPTATDVPRVDLQLEARRLRVADRLISPLSMHVVSVTGAPTQLAIPELTGRIYGGSLAGSGQMSTEKGGEYRLNLSIQDADLDPILHPRVPATQRNAPPKSLPPAQTAPSNEGSTTTTGLFAARLRIQGVAGDPAHRHGDGQVDVHDAHLYDLPFALGLVQLVNFSLPTSRSFDRAAAMFQIDGSMLRFDSIRFQAPTVMIAGDGTMDLTTRQLDLDFFTRNPSGINLGPVTDILRAVKDELISIHVGGTLTQPKMQPRSFRTFRKSFEDMAGNPPRKEGGALPAPPAVPVPASAVPKPHTPPTVLSLPPGKLSPTGGSGAATAPGAATPYQAPLVGAPSTSDQ